MGDSCCRLCIQKRDWTLPIQTERKFDHRSRPWGFLIFSGRRWLRGIRPSCSLRQNDHFTFLRIAAMDTSGKKAVRVRGRKPRMPRPRDSLPDAPPRTLSDANPDQAPRRAHSDEVRKRVHERFSALGHEPAVAVRSSQAFERLCDRVRDRKVIPWIGAGASLSVFYNWRKTLANAYAKINSPGTPLGDSDERQKLLSEFRYATLHNRRT